MGHPLTHFPAQLQTLLLATKLVPPRVPVALVTRERLLRNLDAVLSHQVTLLSATAGWGKTTLLSAWATTHPSPLAWLSLDELDNEPTRFWTAMVAALRTCLPTLGETVLAMLHSPTPPPLTTILTVLLNELATVATSSVLLLDDYHLITDAAIHESVSFLIDHLPSQWHIVIATRIDPDLPLARWRVRGELGEIRAADLRFTAAEAAIFFAQTLEPRLADEEVAQLEQRTEGWAAGLQLAALALRQRTDRAAFVQHFTGSHRYLLDYVQTEILDRQPLTVQRFLLHTAVLTRLNAQVCAALTDNPASQQMLESLERNNLFVVPLDDQRHWYRLHDLFREVLLARLQVTEPEQVPRLHQRAAQWYAAQNELSQAIAHALTAADFAYAAELIERAAPRMWLQGEAQTVHTWIGALPDAIFVRHARLALEAARRLLETLHSAVSVVYARMQPQVERQLARLEALLQKPSESTTTRAAEQALAAISRALPPALPPTEVALIQRRIRLLRALIASRTILMHGDTERLRLLAEEAEKLSAQEEMSWKLIALSLTFWHTESLQRQGARLIPRLLAEKQQALAAGDPVAMVRVMRMLAFAYLRAGRLHLLHDECLAALTLIEQSGEQSISTGYLHYFLSGAYYGWNRLEEALHQVQQVLRVAHTWQHADLLIAGTTEMVTLMLATGDLTGADETLQKAEALIQQERFMGDTHRGAVVVARVYYWLATRNLAAASAWAEQAVFSPETWNPNRDAGLSQFIRVYLAQQQYGKAVALLERFSVVLDRPDDRVTTTDYLALRLAALNGDGQYAHARSTAIRLLTLTVPEENLRPYLDIGEPMRRALQRLLAAPAQAEDELPPNQRAFVIRVLAAFPQETPLPVPHLPAPVPAPPTRAGMLSEPLTRREEEVLRLLVAGASNQEIAAALVISLATVKKHVSNVLGKLAVATRSQAIARMRDWTHLT